MSLSRACDIGYAASALGLMLLIIASACAIALALLAMIFAIPATKLLRVVQLSATAVARSVAGLVIIERQNPIPGAN